MKKLALLMFFAVFSMMLNAQVNTDLTDANGVVWKNAFLRSDGRTELGGVEAYCTKTTCNDEAFIVIKFINKNDYKVRLEWKDAIFINGVWYYSKTTNPKVFYVEPKATITGKCDGEFKLKVSISSIVTNPEDFQHFSVSGLTVSK